MVLDSDIDRSLVKDAVPDKTIDDVVDLRQEFRYLRRVLLMTFRHRRGDYASPSIHPNMQFLPASDLLLAVFLAMPFTLATNL